MVRLDHNVRAGLILSAFAHIALATTGFGTEAYGAEGKERSDWERLAPPPGKRVQIQIAEVSVVSGEARATRVVGESADLRVGDAIYVGDILQTSPAGTLGISFSDGTLLAVGRGGELIIEKTSVASTATTDFPTIALVGGAAQLVSKQAAPGRESMTFKTPVATAMVREANVVASFDPRTGDALVLLRPFNNDNAGDGPASGVTLTLPKGQVVGSHTGANRGWRWNPTRGESPQVVELSEGEAMAMAEATEATLAAMQRRPTTAK